MRDVFVLDVTRGGKAVGACGLPAHENFSNDRQDDYTHELRPVKKRSIVSEARRLDLILSLLQAVNDHLLKLVVSK
jgi:hypothetical protein